MKTLEELGYEKVEENEYEIIYAYREDRSISISVGKTRKQVFKSMDVRNIDLAECLTIDELKAVLALLEENE